jgi:cell division protein FtsI/penicillin-binding protein 2
MNTSRGKNRSARLAEAQDQQALQLKGMQRRIEVTFYLLLVPLFFLAGRLVQLQALGSMNRPARSGAETFSDRKILPAHRGQILAADGTAIAVTLDEYAVCANPRAVHDKEKMARLLAGVLHGNEAEYLGLLNQTTRADGKKKYYVRLARHVDETRIKKLRELMGPKGKDETRKARAARKDFWAPITLEPTPRRQYPLGDFASQVIGFKAGKTYGYGLEHSLDSTLSGTDGEVVSQIDAQGRPVPGFVEEWREPVAGQTVVTTIEPAIQAATDAVMRKIVQKFKPQFATAIVMRPKTGEVVAMSTAPSFDLNRRPQNVAELTNNRCLEYAYEPGSTFKIITAAAAIENVPDWRDHSFICNGIDTVGGRPMRCWVNSVAQRRHGDEDLSESIRDSCNFGVYGFARLTTAPTLLQYAKRFGLGKHIDMAGLPEHPGYLAGDPDEWGARQLASFSFGQSMKMTPMQLVRAAATIANDGVMMKPMLIKELRNEQGEILREYRPQTENTVEQPVIKPETARLVRGMMERVVVEGSARKFVFVPGYASAGKTGSAQKAEGRRGYAANKFISSFVGFLPSRKPEFVILVMADEPHGSHWGSEVCGPAYTEIAAQAMLNLRLRKGVLAPAPIPALMERPKEKRNPDA